MLPPRWRSPGGGANALYRVPNSRLGTTVFQTARLPVQVERSRKLGQFLPCQHWRALSTLAALGPEDLARVLRLHGGEPQNDANELVRRERCASQ